MIPVGFEPMISVFERVKTVHALDRDTSCKNIYLQWISIKIDYVKQNSKEMFVRMH
jgi:hypothetical protein